MSLSRRQFRTLLLVGLVAGAALTPLITAALTPYLSNSGAVSGPAPFNASASGPTVTLTGSTEANLTAPFPNENTVRFRTGDGNVSFVSSAKTHADIAAGDINGTTTQVTNLSVGATDLYIEPEDKPAVNVSGDIDNISFQSMALDDGQSDFTYGGASGTSTVTVRGLAGSTGIAAVDAADGTVLDVATTDGSGTATLAMPNSQHTVELETSDDPPVLTDPRPRTNRSAAPGSLSVNVDDGEFPGDTVDVEFFFDGSSIGTNETNTTGRVSTSNLPTLSGGVYDWSAVATDDRGHQDVVNATFGTPGDLYIRNETNASQLVTDPVDVTVRFQNGTIISERTTDTGVIDMSGIGSEAFTVNIEASQDYYQRTVYFESLIGNRSVYLLNQNRTAHEARFQLEDPTGQYDSSTILYVRKAINQSGTLSYRTIYADRFGAEGVTADLESGERYRLLLRSDDGTLQEVGPYRADVSETVTVTPGSPTIDLGEYTDGWAANAELDGQTLEVRYSDPEQTTQQVTLFIHEKGNPSNQLAPNSTYYDLGSLSTQYALTQNESELTWVVVFDVERESGEFTTQREVSNMADLVPSFSDRWRLFIALGILFMASGVFSVLNRGVGAVVTAVTGGLLYWTGWLSGATAAAGVVIALFIAVLYNIYTTSGY